MYRLLLLCLLAFPLRGHAQWAVTEWVETRIDEHLVVQLPYVTLPDPDTKAPGTQSFVTETESIILLAGSVDLRYLPKYNPNGVVTLETLNKSFNRLIRHQSKKLKSAAFKMESQGNVIFAKTPARAVRYSYLDEVREQPAYFDMIFLWRGDTIYLFGCGYRLPETNDAVQDRKHFLQSVVFDATLPGKEL
ncbi:hypothetical protein [Hymenobacter lucidus]|uniref:DUF1795 domain-containing protein n=1 Tax=Hymenobacter lucidus TaxID=2880930 RepID=A0ABS8AUC5_9BACT|nr:hypothetical protein [Hymenobacter lucidus]MCB2409805.1 hypothetical protein [Hymenobacter lucidus]